MDRIKSWYIGFCQRVVANSWLFVAVWLLQIALSLQLLPMWSWLEGWMIRHSLMGATFWAVLLLILVSIPPRRIGRWLSWGALVVVFLITFLEQYVISCYRTCVTSTIMMLVLSTNTREASEFLSVIDLRPLALILGIVLVVSAASVGYRRLTARIQIDRWWKVALLTLLLVLPCFGYRNNIRTYREGLTTTFPIYAQLAPIDRFWQSTYLTWNTVKQIDRLHREFETMDIGRVQVTKDLGSHTVVLIIGESLRRNSMHCYGCPYPTTPHLDSLARQGDLILFSDVVSSKSNTDPSLCELLTFHTTDQRRPWYEYPTIVQTMSASGYYTYWLSNQEKVLRFGQAMLVIPPLADSSLFVNSRLPDDDLLVSREESYDERVLPRLMVGKQFARGRDKLFEIIHLSGQHMTFSKRYPKRYAHFDPQDIAITVGEPNDYKRSIKAEYLNSILYNDWVVSTIMHSYDDTPALIFYLSDHGLDMYDNPAAPESMWHDVSKQALPIPFMVYVTPAMRRLHPELYTQIKEARERPIMSDILTHSITGLLGIVGQASDDRYNVFSPRYWSTRPRRITSPDGHTVDFPYPVDQDPAIGPK